MLAALAIIGSPAAERWRYTTPSIREMDSSESPAVKIGNAEWLADRFGYWPSFHDAEIHRLEIDRGDATRAPSVLVAIHVFDSDGSVDERGFYRTRVSVRTQLVFDDVDELELHGLSSQNVIFGLQLAPAADGRIAVTFAPCYGIAGTLTCGSVDVVNVEPWPAPGNAGSR